MTAIEDFKGTPPAPLRWGSGLQRRLFASLAVSAVLVLGVGGWAALAHLSGAVIAPGLVVVKGSSKKVQHPTGGVIGDIRVRDGDRVAVGDVLLRLDDTQTRAALGVVQSQLTEFTGRKARLSAQRDGRQGIAFPDGFAASGIEAQRVAEGEQRLFEALRDTANGQKSQLRERVGQYKQEIEGLSVQRDAKRQEIELVEEELARVGDMSKRQLVPITRLLTIKREAIRVKAEYGALLAQIARAEGQVSETGLQILTIDQGIRSDAQKELREIEARVAELSERKIAAEDQLRRVDMRAPHDGIVHELAVHTVGAVIAPGETVMTIVPSGEVLEVEIKIAPADIDQVAAGQQAMLRFSAFNQRTTAEVAGKVARVSADLTHDPKLSTSYYVGQIEVGKDNVATTDSMKLIPGMPVEVFIETGQRTALAYFTKPLTDQFARAFREN